MYMNWLWHLSKECKHIVPQITGRSSPKRNVSQMTGHCNPERKLRVAKACIRQRAPEPTAMPGSQIRHPGAKDSNAQACCSNQAVTECAAGWRRGGVGLARPSEGRPLRRNGEQGPGLWSLPCKGHRRSSEARARTGGCATWVLKSCAKRTNAR